MLSGGANRCQQQLAFDAASWIELGDLDDLDQLEQLLDDLLE